MKKQPQPDEGPRCGSCAFWRSEDGQDVGECYANPPSTESDDEGVSFYNSRPILEATDYPCRHYRGKQ